MKAAQIMLIVWSERLLVLFIEARPLYQEQCQIICQTEDLSFSEEVKGRVK